ncbi:MAG: toxin-antitoxin system YwqK family antitoxin [Chitinophaga sp.]
MLIICAGFTMLAAAQTAANQTDAKGRKQGPWAEQVAPLRGEPGYTWEGIYNHGRKEGVWKKYSVDGDVMAEETFKFGVLDGLCKYYYPNGRISAVGNMLSVDIDGQKDTVVVVDPVSGQESLTEVTRKGYSVKHGEWKVYDEDGAMMRETYDRGELSSSVIGNRPRQQSAPLPHEAVPAGKKKRGRD